VCVCVPAISRFLPGESRQRDLMSGGVVVGEGPLWQEARNMNGFRGFIGGCVCVCMCEKWVDVQKGAIRPIGACAFEKGKGI
jgi:hypothetical protein